MVSIEQKKHWIDEVLAGKKSQSDVARESGLSRQAVSQWMKLYRKLGSNGIRNRRGRPKIKRLPDEDLARLKTIVTTRSPVQAGLDPAFDSWNCEAVQQLIIREVGVKLTYRFILEYLDEWGVPDPQSVRSESAATPKRRPGRPAGSDRGEAAGASDSEKQSQAFSRGAYEKALAESHAILKSQAGSSTPPRRMGRHAFQRAAPGNNKRNHRRNKR